ncbi:MAG: hypothetical protein GX852_02725 [Clostridiales bacterium]|jgi:multimeric flavodoxin WrbA|nr:hypothetical protein [Clostridiales bacterium]
MNKNVLIISSSPRKGGNSEELVASFAKGAESSGNKVETVFLRDKELNFCKGCFGCLQLGHCVISDDAVDIVAKMHDADVLVFATPVYYYSVTGQLKTMLDRANPLFNTDYGSPHSPQNILFVRAWWLFMLLSCAILPNCAVFLLSFFLCLME